MRERLLNRLCAVSLILAVIFTTLPVAGCFDAYAAIPTQKKIYKKIVAKKSTYPEGKKWDDDSHFYENSFDSGSGCYAFALQMSDAVFGKKRPYTEHTNLGELKVGDIVQVNKGNHYVVVLKKNKKKKYINVVEANYKGKIHWNRKITYKKLKKFKYLYILTRYYWQSLDLKKDPENVELNWTKLTKSQRKKIDGIAVFRNNELMKRLGKTATSYTDEGVGTEGYADYYYNLKTFTKTKTKTGKIKYKYSNISSYVCASYWGE